MVRRLELFKYIGHKYVAMAKKKGTFTVIIEKDEDGYYFAKAIDLDGCFTQGETLDEVLKNIREAIELCLEELEEDEIPESHIVGVQQMDVQV